MTASDQPPELPPTWVDLKIQASLAEYAKRAEVEAVRKEFRDEVHRLQDADRGIARDIAREAKARGDLAAGMTEKLANKLDNPGLWKVVIPIGVVALSALLGPLLKHFVVRFLG